ncbi:cytochrome c biogenesis heme-transporting ATPase CcmA [Thiomicrorhabdus lithotrophica]|uniref:Cytochrome c biogenesis heme-transporting ATPase CcmA n=1 Tax=Thiomicrorhabdus lithotrophica TaxID=2949997 RepID=A0ABY8C8C2_9GAMM|nr:cytochrome c biogenesis heme-transporting ATPase CcmA [Thiomicrorhabdus lithotrophica]WEJ62213.1 cytochrome c biogenesis heme-transporting ATPase CcmA [Thiomicrorhabdus lithotrophica]
MLFSAHQLSCIRSHKTLFQNVSFELSPGQLLLVEGKNGAGKTSLLKLLSGLRRPDSGEVKWNQVNILQAESDFRTYLAWLGHQNPLKEDQTALENLTMLGHIRQRNQISMIEAVKTVHLGHVKHKFVKTFSAGMKRRLSLASLLIAKTPLWILDEPQAALDKAGITLFETLAEQHLKKGGMIIMTSHHSVNIAPEYIQTLVLGHD